MAKLTVILTEKVPTSLRGELTQWMLEPKPGVFVGSISALVREKLWQKIQSLKAVGSAILIFQTKNEQNFDIFFHGYPTRKIIDFEGIKLIKIPISKKISKKIKFIVQNGNKRNSKPQKHTEKRVSHSKSKNTDISLSSNIQKHKSQTKKIEFDPIPTSTLKISQNFEIEYAVRKFKEKIPFPDNFILRYASFSLKDNKILGQFSDFSTYSEYPNGKTWFKKYITDLCNYSKEILTLIKLISSSNGKLKIPEHLINKKIVSLDIETTDYLYKAYEGFVNIIGISVLHFDKNDQLPSLECIQVFNMLRKIEYVPDLIKLIEPFLRNTNYLIVFNQDFDIKILQTVINSFSLNIKIPGIIIDPSKKFTALRNLELELFNQFHCKRFQSTKGKYSDYYKLFKGTGKNQKNKLIEPIGQYNLVDTLSPMLYFLYTLKGNTDIQ